MTIKETLAGIIAILMISSPFLLILYSNEILDYLANLLDKIEEEEEEEHQEDDDNDPTWCDARRNHSTTTDHTELEPVYKVESVAPLDCYDDKEAIKINSSYHAVKKGAVNIGDLVYLEQGKIYSYMKERQEISHDYRERIGDMIYDINMNVAGRLIEEIRDKYKIKRSR